MTTTINTPRAPTSGPKLDFTWTNNTVAHSFNVGGNQYPYTRQADNVVRASDVRYSAFTTPTNIVIEFTAQVALPPGRTITSYFWDFGDGDHGLGPVVKHTYRAANPTLAVALRVVDDRRNEYVCNKMLNLIFASILTVGEGLRTDGA